MFRKRSLGWERLVRPGNFVKAEFFFNSACNFMAASRFAGGKRAMLNLTTSRIFVHTGQTDMRKGFSGLSGIVREQFQADPTDGSLYIFINRRRDRMKLLHFVEGGFWLYYRLLEAGTFEPLCSPGEGSKLEIDSTQLSMLLSGVSLVASVKRRKRYVA